MGLNRLDESGCPSRIFDIVGSVDREHSPHRLGYQTGWTPFVYWVRKQPLPRREFVTRGAYRWLRHPVYLSFLGLIWFTPHMTLDHVILTALWTIYIFLGSYFKDRRLAQMIGADYLEYQSRVPGYPLFFWGPLGKIPLGNRSNV